MAAAAAVEARLRAGVRTLAKGRRVASWSRRVHPHMAPRLTLLPRLPKVIEAWEEPRHEEFAPRTA